MDQKQLEKAAGLSVSRETYNKLKHYQNLLMKWNKAINLVAPGTIAQSWERHILDSAQLVRYWPQGTQKALDFGSGGGFPGMVLAVLLGGACHFTLCESDQRKCQFLRTVSRETKTDTAVLNQRIEAIDDPGTVVDVITARAFAPLGDIFDYALPWAEQNPDLVLLLLKGARSRQELKAAKEHFVFDYEERASVVHDEGCVLRVWNLRARIT